MQVYHTQTVEAQELPALGPARRPQDRAAQQLRRHRQARSPGLLDDLKARGLLDDTLVVWGGEFGRTPTAEGTDGREHHPFGFTMWLAGGGVKGGIVHGATDEFGWHAVEDKVHVHDLHATILHLMGIDHDEADLPLQRPRLSPDRRLRPGRQRPARLTTGRHFRSHRESPPKCISACVWLAPFALLLA